LTGAGIVAVVGMVSLIIGVGPTGRASPTTNVELAVPARLGGMSRVADRAGHDAEDAVTRRLQVLLPDAIAGLYLDERTGESVVLVASRHAGDKLTAADLVPAVAVAARQEIGIGATVSVDRLQPIPRDGAAYLCGATTGRIDSAVCMWRADGVVAVLLGLSSASPDELATWSAAAHQALRG
jgi:hypothetical protein